MRPTPIPKDVPVSRYETRNIPTQLLWRVKMKATEWRTTQEDAFNIIVKAGLGLLEGEREKP